MRATLDKDGHLEIIAESGAEAYALRRWFESMNTPDAGVLSWRCGDRPEPGAVAET
jgi:hypothetical protein